MHDMKCGYWLSSALATNVILGWIPDFLIVYEDIQGATNPYVYCWSKAVHDGVISGQFGWVDASTGDWAACADADNGIDALVPSGQYVNIESPIAGVGKKARPVNNYAITTTMVARAADVIGSIVRPTVRNGYVYEVTSYSAATGSAEPTWPTTPGDSVTEATSGNIFTCREEEIVMGGGYGFTMGTTVQTNGHYCFFMAFKSDKDAYFGDAAEGNIYIG